MTEEESEILTVALMRLHGLRKDDTHKSRSEFIHVHCMPNGMRDSDKLWGPRKIGVRSSCVFSIGDTVAPALFQPLYGNTLSKKCNNVEKGRCSLYTSTFVCFGEPLVFLFVGNSVEHSCLTALAAVFVEIFAEFSCVSCKYFWRHLSYSKYFQSLPTTGRTRGVLTNNGGLIGCAAV